MDTNITFKDVSKWTVYSIGIIAILVGGYFLLNYVGANFARYQRIQDADNQVQLNEITISQEEQNIKVTEQKAQIRVEEAKGIANAQKIISGTLTDAYLQYEAIQAQIQMANSPNHTEIYIPTGNNGIPLVKTLP